MLVREKDDLSANRRIEPASYDEAPRVEAASFVLALRSRGISDLAILRAMETVPRELFAPRRYLDLARQDVALPLAFGQTMTGPGTVAIMLAALAVRPGHRVLEIGTGSGYVAALIARLGGRVRTVEAHPVLAETARRRLETAGFAGACEVVCGDGLAPDGTADRFDRVLVNGTVAALPPDLPARLAAGGRLVFGLVGGKTTTALISLVCEQDGQFTSRTGQPLRLSRLLQSSAPGEGGGATEA